jgi:23S rRNA (guanine1835-N2)-methyltransferase
MTAAPNAAVFDSPYGTFDLVRYPSRPGGALLAWCAADTLLLEEAHRRGTPGAAILVANDTHGALCVALQPQALWTDSALAALSLRHNERSNGRAATPILWSTQTPPYVPELVILRIPKQLQFFEYQLRKLATRLPAGATVLAAGMDKHLSPRAAPLLERCIGPTQRHRGQHRARLFTAVRDSRPALPFPGTAAYCCGPLGVELRSRANVFSADKLDTGTRFLLEQLHHLAPVDAAIDLACGNGVLGLAALQRGLAQRVVFCDESAMAIASAQDNTLRLLPGAAPNCRFHHGDALRDYQGEAVQLILCNPPFHQDHVVDESIGRHLLAQCRHHLHPGGQLCLVANRHLGYLPLLKRSFQQVQILAANSKFNVFLARNA